MLVDPTLRQWPGQWMENFKRDFLDAYPKTAGYRAVRRFWLPVLLTTVLPIWMAVLFC
jgi:hypothetical protein